jgi:hypothetical protein
VNAALHWLTGAVVGVAILQVALVALAFRSSRRGGGVSA